MATRRKGSRTWSLVGATWLVAALALGCAGCVKQALIDGQIESTRQAASALDSIGDYELASGAVRAGIAQFEGMHALSPDNEDALFLLTKTWTSYGFAFLEDDMQAAEDAGNDERAASLRASAHAAYDRATFYGVALLSHRARGFENAKRDADTFSEWLTSNFTHKDDAPGLLWTGQAWLSRVNVMMGDDEGPTFLAEAWVGAELVQRAIALDPSAEHYAGLAVLAAYHSSSGYSLLAEGKALFDLALAKTDKRALLAQVLYATTYACVKGDRALYVDLLTAVSRSEELDASQRLENAIAKRRARRWLGAKRARDACGIEVIVPAQ